MRRKGKRKRKAGKLFMAVSLLAVAALLVHGGTARSGNRAAGWPGVQDLGEKYLDELDYEEAMAFFENVLKIDGREAEELWDAIESGLSQEGGTQLPGGLPLSQGEAGQGRFMELLDQALGLMPEEFQAEIRKRFGEWMEENGT